MIHPGDRGVGNAVTARNIRNQNGHRQDFTRVT